jgi:hypothetical protein
MSVMLFSTVFLTATAGMLDAPWWAALAGSCAIALILMHEDRSRQMAGSDVARWEVATTMSSLTISFVAGPTAFVAGRVTALVWGL